MINIREARSVDFESIHKLILNEFQSTPIKPHQWKRLFSRHWCTNDDPIGYVLTDDGNIVGFFGVCISYRTINRGVHKFCNLSTWVVKEQFRNNSLALLFNILKMRNVIFTAFTPSATARDIYQALGFQELESRFIALLPIPSTNTFNAKYKLVFSQNKIAQIISDDHKVLLHDHLPFSSTNVVIQKGEEYCLIIGKKTKKKRLPFLQILYISDKDIFASYCKTLAITACVKLRVFGLIIEARHLTQRSRFNLNYEFHKDNSTMFKCAFIERNEIDMLYSELFVLDI